MTLPASAPLTRQDRTGQSLPDAAGISVLCEPSSTL
ncbi:hypothetical protein APECO18_18495 [Escherichia coli APEC O18]|nr:hypothetical protein APECO18_18495 [Escherichia coli APEC O18]ETE10577.1 hypothetical protein V413_08980 [Escherichia coli LAU-EC8]ETE37481.1 hypothetical protein V414_11350 [Escherichia coli LAU-EC9]